CPLRKLIGNANSWGEIAFGALHVSTHGDITQSGQQEVAGIRIPVYDPALSSGLYGLKIVVPHAVINTQLRRHFPDILGVEREASLPLAGEKREDGPIERAWHAQQERRHAEPRTIDVGAGGDRLAEIEITARARIHREEVEAVPADICSPANLVIAANVRPVIDELKTRRAIQARNPDAALDTHEPPAYRSANPDAGQAAGQPVAGVDTRNPHFVIG